MEWKSEIREQLQKIKSEGQQYPQLEQELIIRRREELRSAVQLSCQLVSQLDSSVTNWSAQLSTGQLSCQLVSQLVSSECQLVSSVANWSAQLPTGGQPTSQLTAQ